MPSLSGAARRERLFGALRLLTWTYLGGLAIVIALLVFVGERWWVSIVVLYLPRFLFLAPLVFLSPLAARRSERRLFALQASAAIAAVSALAGPHLARAQHRSGGPSLRVLSYNVWYGHQGIPAIEREVDVAGADVVLFQALAPDVAAHFAARGNATYTHATGEFFIASRFPIVSVGDTTARGFLRYTLDSPLGLLDVYDVHPPSPRPGLHELRHQSKRRWLTEGPSNEAAREVEANTAVREREIAALARAAIASQNPVVLAGDFNLPELSAIYRQNLARFVDGFALIGNGFGYTFPANAPLPWMRIDRILAGPELRFTSFAIGGRGGSDHYPIWADLERR